jgi:hypothetical protein
MMLVFTLFFQLQQEEQREDQHHRRGLQQRGEGFAIWCHEWLIRSRFGDWSRRKLVAPSGATSFVDGIRRR